MRTNDKRTPIRIRKQATEPAAWLAVVGLLILAISWATAPGSADPPVSSWNPGVTVTTWDWERHWNYWMKHVCAEQVHIPGEGEAECVRWQEVGPTWKPCGAEISPPDPSRINSCNIGQAGGHAPHGDGKEVKYTYLGQHEDRTGPTYPVCEGDPSLPVDTSPGNCGTWVTVPHDHCEGDDNAHPPEDCPPTTGTPTTQEPPPTPGPAPTVGPTTTAVPQPLACEQLEVYEAFLDMVYALPDPDLGLEPPANGYVRIPMRAGYPHVNQAGFNMRVDGAQVYVRMWTNRLSWSFTDLGTQDGIGLGNRTYRRYASDYRNARYLRSPSRVTVGGEPAVYLRSSARSGYPDGYPVTLSVTWRGECRQPGVSDWGYLGQRVRRHPHHYIVCAIWSRPS